MAKRPGINWCRSRLHPFESIYSVYAKFSALNGISAPEAIRFVSTYIGMPPEGAALTSSKQVRKLAELLDEPIGIVSTSMLADGFHADWTPFLAIHHKSPTGADHILYCRECIKFGFHGVFHIYGSIPVCPIHCVALSHKNDSLLGSGTERIVRNLISICLFYNADWPAPLKLTQRTSRKKSDTATLVSFLDYSNQSRAALMDFNSRTLWHASGTGPELTSSWKDRIGTELLAIRSTFSRAPVAVSGLLQCLPVISKSEEAIRPRFDDVLMSVVRRVFDTGLISLYRIWWSWTRSFQVGESEFADAVSSISSGHEDCSCVWHLHRRDGGWSRRQIPGYHRGNYKCPYQHAAELLTVRWGSFESSVPRLSRMGTMAAYRQLATDMAAGGMVTYELEEGDFDVASDPARHVRIEWSIPEPVLAFLEKCISAEFNLDVAKCLAWLKLIETGADPGVCESPPCHATAIIEDNEIKIIRWGVEIANARD